MDTLSFDVLVHCTLEAHPGTFPSHSVCIASFVRHCVPKYRNPAIQVVEVVEPLTTGHLTCDAGESIGNVLVQAVYPLLQIRIRPVRWVVLAPTWRCNPSMCCHELLLNGIRVHQHLAQFE